MKEWLCVIPTPCRWLWSRWWWRWQQWDPKSVCPVFLSILIWSASQVGWPRITHYSFSHLEGNWVSRVVNWSRVGFELRTPVFWSGAVSVGVIAFKLWCVEAASEAIVMDGDGGGAQGPTSCLKWNRSPFTCMIYRTLHAILFYKGFWRSSVALCVTKPYQNVLTGRLAGPVIPQAAAVGQLCQACGSARVALILPGPVG